jgi:hypothetical protein
MKCLKCQREHRPLYVIATDIHKAWVNVHFAAEPYLWAMTTLDCTKENYGLDSGDDIVRRFLCNASTFRGEKARSLKAELKALVGL